MSDSYCIIMTTTDSKEEADRLAEMLVSEKLAACVQSLPVASTYTSQGELTRESEWLLLIKAQAEQFNTVQDTLLQNHSYDVPEIIKVPISQGSPYYLAWMDAHHLALAEKPINIK